MRLKYNKRILKLQYLFYIFQSSVSHFPISSLPTLLRMSREEEEVLELSAFCLRS